MTTTDVKQISIRLLPDGFSYLNQFHPVLPGADFIQRLEEAMLETLNGSEEPEAVEGVCSVENVRFFLSPLEIDAVMASKMAKMTLPTLDQEETTLDLTDEALGIRFSFGIDSQLYRFITRNWPELSLTHPLFTLIEKWGQREEINQDCMVAEAGENFLNLLVFKQGRLQLANRFEVNSNENILYHLMNCWTQCGLDIIDHKLYLQTEVKSIRELIGQYIKQCES